MSHWALGALGGVAGSVVKHGSTGLPGRRPCSPRRAAHTLTTSPPSPNVPSTPTAPHTTKVPGTVIHSKRLVTYPTCTLTPRPAPPRPSALRLPPSPPCSNMSSVFHMMAAWVALHLLAVTARALERVVVAVARGDLPGRWVRAGGGGRGPGETCRAGG